MKKSIGQSYKRFFSMPKIVKRFNNDEKGVTAVEFAFVAGPFFLIISSIVEVSIFLFASQYLETSIDNVARDIRTGNLQSAIQTQLAQADNEDDYKEIFQNQLCAEVVVLFNCSDILVQVSTANEFSGLGGLPLDENGNLPLDEDGNVDPAAFSTEDVQAGQIFKVQAIYEWPVYTNYVGRSLTSSNGDSIYMNVTAVVRAEQF